MKPFLLLQIRPEDKASDNEYEAFLKHSGLEEGGLKRMRIENGFPEKINLEDFSGVMLGGGPYNVSDAEEKKEDVQLKCEKDLYELIQKIREHDFPYMGVCYGLGTLISSIRGGVAKGMFSEDVGAVDIKLTEEGQNDPVLSNLPKEFRAFVGHKESCQRMPENATLLAGSDKCPVQMVRYKNNVYGIQFHPELDPEGLSLRINVYKHAGYFPPEDADKLIEDVKKEKVTEPIKILRNFVAKHQS